MKICPTCNQEFENDLDVCPHDDSALEAAEIEDTAEDDATPADAPESVESSSDETADEGPEIADDGGTDSEESSDKEQAVKVEAAAVEGMSTMQKAVVLVVVVLAVGAGLAFWKSNVGSHGAPDLSKMSANEMQLLLKDLDPMQLKAFAEDPKRKEQLSDNLRQILSLASAAQKEGIGNQPAVKAEMEDIRVSLLALNYDRKINGDKGPMPPFGFIGEERVNEFWGRAGAAEVANEDPQAASSNSNAAPEAQANAGQPVPEKKVEDEVRKDDGILVSALDLVGLGWVVGDATARRHEAEFDIFLKHKLELLRGRGQIKDDQEPSEEEINQLRDRFAKTRIYYEEANQKLASAGSLPETERNEWEEFEKSVELQAKLQQAQFLAQNFVEDNLRKKVEVTDDEVKKYLEEHPELTKVDEKKSKAEEVLKKAKGGADFAELAKEYSEDPGSKDNGGLYEGINKGQFAPEFEAAALALQPGQLADKVVKTDFGFHIIRLEKKGEAKGADGSIAETYDVRHILISTMLKDPDNPFGQELTPERFVRAKLEKERQEKVMEEIKKNNPVQIADFEVPQPSAESLEKLRQQQQQQLEQLQKQQEEAESKDGAKK